MSAPPKRWDQRGCAVAVAAAILLPAVGAGVWKWDADRRMEAALTAQGQAAAAEFAPALARLDQGKDAAAPVDLDRTVRVIHGIDLALKQSGSLKEYLALMAREDYRGVDPKVIAARQELMGILMDLYSRQLEQEDQAAMWELTSQLLLQTLSVVEVEGDMSALSPTGGFSVDRSQAQRLLGDLQERQREEKRLAREVDVLENQLIDRLTAYSGAWHETLDEWDRLCIQRDRAYLAVANGDWKTAIEASSAAVAMAPHEKEAHLLLALAIIESGDTEKGDPAQLLEDYIAAHPDSSAPAFLLLGTWRARTGDLAQARLDLQQSATYYPRQADQLTSMLDPYEMRSFLRKSREGAYIVELYKGTMLGAGYFSPDLQMARLLFEAGDAEGGRTKVMDHFARRRSQGQWDFLISDVNFCQELLGADYRLIFPEDAWLDLVAEPTLLGSGLSLSVKNRSDRTLHNTTLVLALHLTDMHPDDYETLTAAKTMPAVVHGQETSFGDVEVAIPMFGETKGVGDIVRTRAILVSNEAVVWVDTDEYKIAEAAEFAAARARAPAPADAAESSAIALLRDQARTASRASSQARIEPRKLLRDDVLIEVPRELMVLRPVFRLRYRGAEIVASENVIDGDRIKLRFPAVADFEPGSSAEPMVLVVGSIFGGMEITFAPNGDVSYRLAGVSEG